MSKHAPRPGGLSALAAINFAFGGLGAIGSAGLIFFFYLAMYNPGLIDEMYHVGPNAPERRAKRVQHQREEMERTLSLVKEKPALYVVHTVVATLTSLLALVSGYGIWRVRKRLGRWVGSLYAVTTLSGALIGSQLLPEDAPGGGFSALTILTMIYPIVLIVLLNTVFAEDFEDAALPDEFDE